MAYQVVKCNLQNIPSSENTICVKEEKCESDVADDKINLSETAIIVDNVEPDYMGYDKIIHCDISTVLDNIKTELSSSEVHYDLVNDNIKIEEGIGTTDIKIEFDGRRLYCGYCDGYYEDYCIGCGMLVHILNRNVLNNADNGEHEELPNDILEIQNSFGQFGIFALKIIPEGVKFGPFSGLTRSESPRKIKQGKFVMNKSVCLTWMQLINPAWNVFEQNLLVFEYEHNIYYQSTRQIHQGDELLVYFREQYEENANKAVDVEFIPITEVCVKDTFACTFCCLGFSSKFYLTKHKSICLRSAADRFSVEELVQCPVCKIHLDRKEYVDHHMHCCCNRTARKSIAPTPDNGNTGKPRRRQIYKCKQCKYRTHCKTALKSHTNQHCKMKTYKCEICNRQLKTEESLRLHVENAHVFVEIKEDPDHSAGDNLKAHIKIENPYSQDEMKQLKCPLCAFQTKYKRCLNCHLSRKHLKKLNYRCGICEYKTKHKTDLDRHIKTKHLKEFKFRCDICDYKTNHKPDLEKHRKAKHLREFDYRCDTCNYKTNYKSELEKHIKTKHLKEFNFKCDLCDYKTNHKPDLEKHIKAKHLKEFDCKCDKCDYQTNNKQYLEKHIKTKHLKEFDDKCDVCDYKTNIKGYLVRHIKTKHLKIFDYKCDSCIYKTNLKPALERHIKTKHLKQFVLKCDACEFRTNYKLCLNKHLKREHLKKR